jgi:hypothetical protein
MTKSSGRSRGDRAHRALAVAWELDGRSERLSCHGSGAVSIVGAWAM